MNEPKKPRLGVLALMLAAYEPLFPGITEAQRRYLTGVLDGLSATADFVLPKIASAARIWRS